MPKTQEYRSVSPEFAGLWSISTTATLLFLMLAGAGAAHAYDFAGGSGEPNDPYQIATAEQLVSIGADPNLLDKSFVLIADLDPNLPGRRIFTRALIAPDVFAPDGSPLPGFAGGFDGNGHALTNLTINGPQEYAVGLFGSVDQSAKVRNLKIKGANIIGGRASGIIGILAGCNCGTISSCCAIGQVTGPADLGGLVGQNAGTIRSCYATVHIRATGLSVAKGGLVGWNFGHVVNCYSTGSVLDESTWVAFVGGVAGHSMVLVDVVQVTDCFWDATIGDVSTGQEASGSSLAPLGGWGLGLTTAQMMDPNTYALNGWADDPNWVLDDGNDYPRLAWEGTPGQPIPAPAIDWFEGAGTPDDPYLVATAEQLARIGTASILWDNSFLLICDVNLAGTNFTPIGHCFGTHFRGVFDGDTRVVSNLTIDGRETARLFSLGMFGYVGPEGSVRRLALRDAQIRCDGPTSNAGVLAGTNDGTITHCSAGGVILAGDTATAMGGLVGFCAGTIANCEATSDVVPGANSWALGGLVGALGGGQGFPLTLGTGTVTDCHATGSVNGADTRAPLNRGLGGLVGNSRGRVSNSWSTGDVTGSSAGDNGDSALTGLFGDTVGGLVGVNDGEISHCWSTGDVDGKAITGGLVGQNNHAITDCRASGSVVGIWSVGGLVGSNFVSGTVTTCSATGAVTGVKSVGGLLGSNGFDSLAVASYATGTVSGADGHVGGLVGDNFGAIAGCYATGNATGNYTIGGLVGRNGETYHFPDYDYAGEISNCYATGCVSGNENTGGLIGRLVSGSLSSSVWDIETAGQVQTCGARRNGTVLVASRGETTAAMQTLDTFLGLDWDFDTIWMICAGQGYPHLQWENIDCGDESL